MKHDANILKYIQNAQKIKKYLTLVQRIFSINGLVI